ncbi:cell division protein ZapE [Neptunomonas japonica]|uniref:cell division protein ZapE n=1 Tax=Neptunomonas japonica TaxID=417574 RepID=UPI0004061B5A|nr:cell division protein ZapE [Neptunomonas japonica]
MLAPLERYHKQLEQQGYVVDPAQQQAVEQLDLLYRQLQQPASGWKGKLHSTKEPIKGLYLWGDVGRGKTFLMDLFYESLPDERKLRLHFHRFMARIHKELNAESGHADPLTLIAKRLAKECNVLCFDEFFVSDIGDAMILGRLFTALFENGLTLVATSNIPIERLYWNGLQRQRFEPAIQLLLKHTQEIHLNGDEDHRLRHLQHQQTYFLSSDAQFKTLFEQLVEPLAEQVATSSVIQEGYQEGIQSTQALLVCKRPIGVVKLSSHVVWFSFDALCNGPRSQLDYIELASRFSSILVSDIPLLGGECRGWIKARGTEDGSFETTETGERKLSYARQDDPARRFISLVDELYDRRVNLYLSADVPLEYLYSGGSLSFEFKRTHSRLVEMQSIEYIDSEHQNA